jgi:hypothetical protein
VAITVRAWPAWNLEQGAGQDFRRHRRGPLTHADQDRAVTQDVNVAAFHAGRQVTGVVAAVPGGEAGPGEHGMVFVDGADVQVFALPGGLGHRVRRDPAVDPGRVVAGEQVVGPGREQEVVGPQHVPLQALGPQRPQVGLEHPADQVLGQPRPVEVLEQLTHRADQRRAHDLGGTHPVQHERPAFGQLQRLGQQLREVVHPHAAVAEDLGEHVVFFLGPGRPQHVVEQQVPDVLRGEPGQLQARPVNDGLAQLAYLGLHAERHDCPSGFPPRVTTAAMSAGAGTWPRRSRPG